MSAASLEDAIAWAESVRTAGGLVVSTNGCFDLLHAGHAATLERARAMGDGLVVLVNSDVSIRRLKGPERPFVPEAHRVALLEALRSVDRVVLFDGDTPLDELAALRPDVHVKGGSYIPERVEAEQTLLARWGGRLEVVPLVPGVSTTEIARTIRRRASVEPWSSGSRYPQADRARVVTVPFHQRENLVTLDDFAPPPDASTVGRFQAVLPSTRHRTNAADNLTEVVHALQKARAAGRTVSWACGPHLIKYGLTDHLISLMEHRLVTQVATNGAGAIHDVEIALFGATSEEMQGRIHTGEFGMARETGAFIHQAAAQAATLGQGFGETIGKQLLHRGAPHARHSLFAQAYRLGIPVTVHVAIGTDIVHMHPGFDGAATGAASGHDFDIFSAGMDRLSGGGVHLNVASSVVLPEVFLKALTLTNNLRRSAGKDPVRDFLTVTIDHQSEYRPLMNVVRRPTRDLGKGIELLGRIEILLPLLTALLLQDDPPVCADERSGA